MRRGIFPRVSASVAVAACHTPHPAAATGWCPLAPSIRVPRYSHKTISSGLTGRSGTRPESRRSAAKGFPTDLPATSNDLYPGLNCAGTKVARRAKRSRLDFAGKHLFLQQLTDSSAIIKWPGEANLACIGASPDNLDTLLEAVETDDDHKEALLSVLTPQYDCCTRPTEYSLPIQSHRTGADKASKGPLLLTPTKINCRHLLSMLMAMFRIVLSSTASSVLPWPCGAWAISG